MKISRVALPALVLQFALTACPSFAIATESEREFSTAPTMNEGRKWRLAYYEGGPHTNYYKYLGATIRGLMDLGWIEQQEIPVDRRRDTRKLWRWLAREAKSDYLRFLDNAYYSANWDNAVRERMRGTVINRLNSSGKIDLIIAMGTWAGKDLANDQHSTPTMVMSSSDPVRSEIINSIEDSGFDHVHARVDPNRYERQMRIFHDVIKFDKLGVAYEDSVVGKSYAAIDMVEAVAEERGFEIVRCYTLSDIADQRKAAQSVIQCFRKLAREVDAIYVTIQGGVNSETIPELVRLANEHKVPTFSQLGSEEAKSGILLSISHAGGFRPVGRFLAATMAKIYNGAKPRQLSQVFEEAPNIAINLKTVEIVGIYLYADVLAAADEIYREIAGSP